MRFATLPVVFGLDELGRVSAPETAMPHVASGLDGRASAGQQPMVGSTPRIGFDSQVVHWLNGLGFGACARHGMSKDMVAQPRPCYPGGSLFQYAGEDQTSIGGGAELSRLVSFDRSRKWASRNSRDSMAALLLFQTECGLASMILGKLRRVDKAPGTCHRHHRASRVVFVRGSPTADRIAFDFKLKYKAPPA